MRKMTLELDVLRTFVTGVELGSFARAADRLGRSTSAVSAQLKKLEDQLDQPVLRKAGRGMALTPAGETLLAYARRLLELNDEAVTALRGTALEGAVRLGMQQDFGEQLLTEVLGRFARAHPQVSIDAQVARNARLLEQVAAAQLDLALAWDTGGVWPYAQHLGQLPLRWLAGAHAPTPMLIPGATPAQPLPLVMLDAPCVMRAAAIAALDRAGIAWRIAFTSASLAGIWAAVAAGLGVTVRTAVGVPASVRLLPPLAMPPLPSIGLGLLQSEAQLAPVAQRLRDIVLQAVAPEIVAAQVQDKYAPP
jgi:DNA-binding transcriptional LysR family regulator